MQYVDESLSPDLRGEVRWVFFPILVISFQSYKCKNTENYNLCFALLTHAKVLSVT